MPAPEPNSPLVASAESIDLWEEAYRRFETPAEEVRKFTSRLNRLGARQWPREAAIVELFCGRGNGLVALSQMGFTNVTGVDLSAALVGQYQGPASCLVADCRELPFADASQDVLIAQGGLHHLPTLPEDLERTLREMRRVLKPGGRVAIVEPWLTAFLRFVHAVCRLRLARRFFPKIDALATMIHYERHTYEEWLSRPREIQDLLSHYFDVEWTRASFGKLWFLGRGPT